MISYISKLHAKTRKILGLVLFSLSFPVVYFPVLEISQSPDISLFSALSLTFFLLFISITTHIKAFHKSYSDYYDDTSENNNLADTHDDSTTVTKTFSDRDKKRLKYVLDTSNEGLWEWNLRTDKITFSAQCKAILGIDDSSYSFKDFEDSIHEDDTERVNQALIALIERNEPYDITFRMKRPDGRIFWVWDRCGVAEFDNDEPVWIVGIIQDVTETKLNQEKIKHLAYYDQLTKLPNRTLLQEKLKSLIQEDNRQKNAMSALLFVGLDRFKLINDTYGHHMGDRLLVEVAERLVYQVGSKGLVARFGGDEFLIILPHLSDLDKLAMLFAQNLSERLATSISQPVSLSADNDIDLEYSISATIGGITFNSSDTSDTDLLRLADLALCKIKNSAGRGVKIFGLDSHTELDRCSSLQKSFHQAFTDNEFCIYLQPKYDASHNIVGAESLIRWLHPKMGVLTPGAFIDIAEETNLIIPMGYEVLAQACEVLKQWQSNPATAHLTMSVNLSAIQIWHLNFVSDVISVIDASQIDPTKLILEVTETIFLKDVNDAVMKLHKLKELGVKLSLDDFGTGYSSLSYFWELPIDEIKIDRSFVKKIVIDHQAYLMVQSIMVLADNFNLNVVSEGVETEAQFELLKENNKGLFQGFYFDKPMPVAQFQDMVELSRMC